MDVEVEDALPGATPGRVHQAHSGRVERTPQQPCHTPGGPRHLRVLLVLQAQPVGMPPRHGQRMPTVAGRY